MLAGQPPFAEGGIGERVYKHIAADPPDVREFNPAVPAGLWAVLRRMLAKHPDDRFQTPDELIEALRSLREPARRRSRPASRRADSDGLPSGPAGRRRRRPTAGAPTGPGERRRRPEAGRRPGGRRRWRRSNTVSATPAGRAGRHGGAAAGGQRPVHARHRGDPQPAATRRTPSSCC